MKKTGLVADILKKYEMTMPELAKKIGVSLATLYRLRLLETKDMPIYYRDAFEHLNCRKAI